ncbi:hypothetical protein BDF20DRAFT_818737 [Mycotypha africana]|uniref:uncharacterized protein n=1 Tax=Mycotypha africana TaxID=64632 RepID=UPI002301AD62|nr:uncharacterized protein BDF20DRAFT_818737 [Mycotypha africana]KAI8982232.1 hypothetical protein BDF20DRAFT_818737 [Mycotypha africana]
MVRCGGFKIETDSTGEIYHWLKALLDRPKEMPKHLPHNMFYSLSSEPSPNRLYNPDRFMQEEEIADINEKNASYLWSPDHTFATSTPLRPSTAAFTAPQPSPLRQTQPPAIPVTSQEEDEEDLFGSFSGLDGLDLDALEADVLQQRASETTVGASTTLSDSNKSNKRKFSLSMDNDL